MNPVVMRTVARMMAPMLLLLSGVLLARGHDAPGGGFVGGLIAASAVFLYVLGWSSGVARWVVRVDPVHLSGLGLLLALGSGVPAVALGQPYLTGVWTRTPSPWGTHVELGTPLLFDLGVYLLVVGVALGLIFTLEEARKERPRGTSMQGGR